MAEKEKRRSTTFVTSRGTIINVAAPSVYIAPGVTPADVTSPEELREEFGDWSRVDGVYGSLPLRAYSDCHAGTHFYSIARLVLAGVLPPDAFPDNLFYRPRSGINLTAYSYSNLSMYGGEINFTGNLVGKGPASLAYGMMRCAASFVERVGTKSFGLLSYPHFKVELTPTTFNVVTWSDAQPIYGAKTETTALPYDASFLGEKIYTFYLYPNLAIFQVGNDLTTLIWHTVGVPNVGVAPVFICPTNSTMRVAWVDFAVFSNPLKWQPPPLPLWTNETVLVAGSNTRQIPAHPYSAKTFYLISDQNGTVTPQIDWGDGIWRNLPAEVVTANVLWFYQTLHDARFMRLNFVPSAQATVSARALLRY